MIWLFFIVIVICFFENIKKVDAHAFERKELSFDNFMFWFSVQGFAFTCHPTMNPIVNENRDQKRNAFAVGLGFFMGWFIKLVCGGLGALAIYKKHPKDPSNVVNYFAGHWQEYLFSSCLLIYLICIFPVFPYVCRDQFFKILP